MRIVKPDEKPQRQKPYSREVSNKMLEVLYASINRKRAARGEPLVEIPKGPQWLQDAVERHENGEPETPL